MRFSPSPRPTVVVVLPSPAGVGLIAVTRISLPSLPLVERGDEVGRDLRLVVAVGQQVLGRDAELGADLQDRLLLRGARDLDVGRLGHVATFPRFSLRHTPEAPPPRANVRRPCRFRARLVRREDGARVSGAPFAREKRDAKDHCGSLRQPRRRDAGAGRAGRGPDRRLRARRLGRALLGRRDRAPPWARRSPRPSTCCSAAGPTTSSPRTGPMSRRTRRRATSTG